MPKIVMLDRREFQLNQIASVRAVRGNNDKEWAGNLPYQLDFELGGVHFCMTHKKKDLPKDLSQYDIVVIGHSHQYVNTWIDYPDGCRTLLINPGSLPLVRLASSRWTISKVSGPMMASWSPRSFVRKRRSRCSGKESKKTGS